ncbi:hypothetical protein POSPLADRAFT_1044253 [Postia placenta MAD-698-R-SB12]|uniref:Uncharacterized protein n=1 Tax=Postia placenta MAD-698-R-SB12 TaxID=670580 RepID=A0A1X6N897_9APHY|nr:hypothetical protein POSPLADRAFT_1044253 [Postia placenta MAD-698-R-SB12]OSX64804.1 hypothetical protein POSPLADRAFT_1044253 [Postia placenta MAD-698-R-SB12]
MSLNDKDVTLGGNKGVDLHPGVANPTASSTHADPLAANFVRPPWLQALAPGIYSQLPLPGAQVTDPTTGALGAGAGGDFAGHREARRNFSKTAGVVEGRPGIIETTDIDPLNENSNKDDGWANATDAPSSRSTVSGAANTASSYAASAASVAAGAAKVAYGHVVGDEATKEAGKEAVWGKQ